MKKLEAFVEKHDKAILNVITALFLIPMAVLAVIDMDNVSAVVGLLVGYVVVVTVILSIAGAGIRRDQRNRVAQNRAASQRNRKTV